MLQAFMMIVIGFVLGLGIGWIIWHARYCARCRKLMQLEDEFRAAYKEGPKDKHRHD